MLGTLDWVPVTDRLDLVAEPVRALAGSIHGCYVAPIDAALADTAAFCERYDVPPERSANCVVIAARRGQTTTYAAVVVLASTQADVNGVIRKHLGARRASFAPQDQAVALTSMEYGGITPIGLPDDWHILIDTAVVAVGEVVIGSGTRASKILVPAKALVTLPNAEELSLTR
jgi:prolyl-tRNA editing enzyme YbaK/EbsC (Cys-tRNA(Pro) deacylase)